MTLKTQNDIMEISKYNCGALNHICSKTKKEMCDLFVVITGEVNDQFSNSYILLLSFVM